MLSHNYQANDTVTELHDARNGLGSGHDSEHDSTIAIPQIHLQEYDL
jgi:hypothetical protein